MGCFPANGNGLNQGSRRNRDPSMSGKELPSTEEIKRYDHMNSQGPRGWSRWRKRKKAATSRVRRRVLEKRVIREQLGEFDE